MANPVSRPRLPDEWAEMTHCPVCDNTPLKVVRQTDYPDRLSCGRCGTVFEVEQDGNRVFLVVLPKVLPPDMTRRWMTTEEVHARVRTAAQLSRSAGKESPSKIRPPDPFKQSADIEGVSSAPPPPKASQQVPAFTTTKTGPVRPPAEVVTHAQQLYDMGNSPARVRSILDRTHTLTPAELDVAMAPVEKAARQKKTHNRNGVIIGVGILVVILLCVGVITLLINPTLSVLLKVPGTAGTPETFLNRSQLPAALQTLVPPGQKILTQATPIIVPQPDRANEYVECPNYPIEAAQIFGGPQDRWSKENRSWVMFMPVGVDIFVPAGMQADYFVFGINTKSETVSGPVKIRNIYLININCESH